MPPLYIRKKYQKGVYKRAVCVYNKYRKSVNGKSPHKANKESAALAESGIWWEGEMCTREMPGGKCCAAVSHAVSRVKGKPFFDGEGRC